MYLHLAITPTTDDDDVHRQGSGGSDGDPSPCAARYQSVSTYFYQCTDVESSRDKHMQCNASCTSLTRRRAVVELQTAAGRENPPLLSPSKHFNPQVVVVGGGDGGGENGSASVIPTSSPYRSAGQAGLRATFREELPVVSRKKSGWCPESVLLALVKAESREEGGTKKKQFCRFDRETDDPPSASWMIYLDPLPPCRWQPWTASFPSFLPSRPSPKSGCAPLATAPTTSVVNGVRRDRPTAKKRKLSSSDPVPSFPGSTANRPTRFPGFSVFPKGPRLASGRTLGTGGMEPSKIHPWFQF